MALIEINKNPSKRELKWFGLLFLLFWGIVGTVVYHWTDSLAVPQYMWGAAAILTVLYYVLPPFRRVLYLAWLYAAFPLGWCVSHLVLAITYYLVLSPIGLGLRLAGRDPMNRKLEPEAETYWVKHVGAESAARYFRQY